MSSNSDYIEYDFATFLELDNLSGMDLTFPIRNTTNKYKRNAIHENIFKESYRKKEKNIFRKILKYFRNSTTF